LIFLNQILQGVLLGGYYALIACGLSFMFGVMGVINLAHGSLAVVSAYALYVLADRFGIQPFLGLGLVIPLMALVGWAMQRFVLERSARGGLLVPVLSTFGLSIILDNLLFQGFGADTRSLAPYIGDLSYDSWSLTDDIAIGKLAALTMAVAIALLGGIQIFLNRTLIGRPIRSAWSASTRGASMRWPPRSPWRRSQSPALFSACARPSILTPARRSSSLPSRPR
jgi:branched-chain amino acid transport system permease protein